jgi:osmotically-inducible protein OsmY
MKNKCPMSLSTRSVLLGVIAVAALSSGCVPLIVGGAALGGAAVVTDRRTTATQLEDQAIELKAGNRINELLGSKHHVDVTSYNRTVLLTGEVFNEADRTAVEQAVPKVENVKGTVNDLAVQWPSTAATRSNDLLIAGKVKATLGEARGLPVNGFKVVVTRGIVYLMGRVTEAEAKQGVDLARAVPGVQKVVRVMEIVSEEQLRDSKPR